MSHGDTATAGTRPGLDRRAAWILLVASSAALVVLAGLLVPWSWVPGGHLTPVPVGRAFDPDQVARAEDYAHDVRLLSWSALVLSLLLACLLGFTRLGSRLARRVGGRLSWWASVPLVVLVLEAAGTLLTLPLGLAVRARNLEAGLTRQSVGGWLGDRALATVVSWVVGCLVVLVVVGLARRLPRRWPLVAGGAVAGLAFAASAAYPVVVEPLFNHFTPMAAGPLRTSLLDLAATEGVRVDDVLVADASRRTTTLNAYVSGIGGTRRIVVYDNLLADLPADQVRAVVAHELGHARHHDVALGTGLGALGGVAGIALLALLLDARRLQRRSGVRGAADPAVVALVLALVAVGSLAASPVENTVSRAIEARADRVSLSATQDPQAFDRLQRQLALRSLADPTPPWLSQLWFGSHPTVLQRLGLAGSLAEVQG